MPQVAVSVQPILILSIGHCSGPLGVAQFRQAQINELMGIRTFQSLDQSPDVHEMSGQGSKGLRGLDRPRGLQNPGIK